MDLSAAHERVTTLFEKATAFEQFIRGPPFTAEVFYDKLKPLVNEVVRSFSLIASFSSY